MLAQCTLVPSIAVNSVCGFRNKGRGTWSHLMWRLWRDRCLISLGLLLFWNVLVLSCFAGEAADKVTSFHYEDYVLMHPLTPCGPLPTALDPNGVYPYVSYCETANRPVLQKHTFVVLENRNIKVTVSPDLGGKVTSLIHKGSGKETLYVP